MSWPTYPVPKSWPGPYIRERPTETQRILLRAAWYLQYLLAHRLRQAIRLDGIKQIVLR